VPLLELVLLLELVPLLEVDPLLELVVLLELEPSLESEPAPQAALAITSPPVASRVSPKVVVLRMVDSPNGA